MATLKAPGLQRARLPCKGVGGLRVGEGRQDRSWRPCGCSEAAWHSATS